MPEIQPVPAGLLSEETEKAIVENIAQQMADGVDQHLVEKMTIGVDPARGRDRTSYGIRVISGEKQALEKKWDADPVKFARDLGVELNRKERQVLRAAMAGRISGKHQRRILETVRQKIERGMQQAASKTAEAPQA